MREVGESLLQEKSATEKLKYRAEGRKGSQGNGRHSKGGGTKQGT